MAWNLIVDVEVRSTDGVSATTPGVDTTGADFLVLALGRFSGAGGENAISDNKGNTWNGLTAWGTGSGRTRIFWCVPTSVGSGHTFSAASASGSAPSIAVQAWSGANASPYASIENGAHGVAAAASLQTGSVTATAAPALLVSAACSSTFSPNPIIDSGFTKTATLSFNAGTAMALAMAYLIQDPAAAINPTWSNLDTGLSKSVAIAAFVPAAGGVLSPDDGFISIRPSGSPDAGGRLVIGRV
jgi:hypothetical protein